VKSKIGARVLLLAALAPVIGLAQQLPGERPAAIAAIPGVVAAGAAWQRVWSGFDNADGIVGTADGGLLFAQEQPSTVRKLDASDRSSVYLSDTAGAGSLSIDRNGRLLAVQRTEPTRIAVLAPERRTLADRFDDGRPLGRLNDLVADGKGGAYFTVGGAYYVNSSGNVLAVATDIRANGIMLSPDERTLYVTNGTSLLAFDVTADGSVRNRRTFGRLQGEAGGDGMTIDAAGRLYVTAGYAIQVFSPAGEHLGLIPAPRQVITVAFSGADKRMLYTVGHGAVGADGVERTERPAKTIYKLQMLAAGFAGRAK
jgi:gluconolactonase